MHSYLSSSSLLGREHCPTPTDEFTRAKCSTTRETAGYVNLPSTFFTCSWQPRAKKWCHLGTTTKETGSTTSSMARSAFSAFAEFDAREHNPSQKNTQWNFYLFVSRCSCFFLDPGLPTLLDQPEANPMNNTASPSYHSTLQETCTVIFCRYFPLTCVPGILQVGQRRVVWRRLPQRGEARTRMPVP